MEAGAAGKIEARVLDVKARCILFGNREIIMQQTDAPQVSQEGLI